MSTRRRILAAIACTALAPLAWGQGDYPGSKLVRMVVPFQDGGESDIVARVVAAKLQNRCYTIVGLGRPEVATG